MDTGAACRIYNVLLSEDRRVLARHPAVSAAHTLPGVVTRVPGQVRCAEFGARRSRG